MENIILQEKILKNSIDTFTVKLVMTNDNVYIINANNIEYKNVLDQLLIYSKAYNSKNWALKKFNSLSILEIYKNN